MSERVLEIERPAGLESMTKNLRWVFTEPNTGERVDLIKNVRDVPGMASQLMAAGKQLGGPTGWNTYARCMQVSQGVTVSVTSQVSRMLEVSKITADAVSDVPLLGNSMEFVWQDPTLPNCVLCIEPIEGRLMTLLVDLKEGTEISAVLTLGRDRISKMLDGTATVDMAPKCAADGVLPNTQQQCLQYLLMLCLKVLAFAAVPSIKEKDVTAVPNERAARKEVGLLSRGSEAPQGMPAFSIRYAPRVIQFSDPAVLTESEVEHAKRRFFGRAGHLRTYKAERYKEARGTWQWIAPTMPPGDIKVTYKVR